MSADPDDRALDRERQTSILKLLAISCAFSFLAGVGVTAWLTGASLPAAFTLKRTVADRAVPIPQRPHEETPDPDPKPTEPARSPVLLPSLAPPPDLPPPGPAPVATSPPAAPKTAPASTDPVLTVRVGAFSLESNATDLADRLEESGYRVIVTRSTEQPGRPLYLVQIGMFQDATLAYDVATELRRREKLDAVVTRYVPQRPASGPKK